MKSILIAENSVNAGIVEEDVTKAAEVKTTAVAEEPIVKTPTKFDRSVQPPVGPDPEVTIPSVWTGSLSNGIKFMALSRANYLLSSTQLSFQGVIFLMKLTKQVWQVLQHR